MSFWQGKTVLVTGGGGFIGSHVVEALFAAGARVTAADDFSNGRRENLASAAGHVRVIEADLTSLDAAERACAGHEVVMHLAARVGGIGHNLRHPATMYRVNARLATAVLEGAQKAGVERFLLVSSACVYRRHCTIPTPEAEGFEGSPEPTNEGYGWAKRMSEFEAAAINKEFGLKVAIARPYNTYGPRDHFDPELAHVIPALIRRVAAGEDPVRVWGDGSATRSFLYVSDLADALLLAAERYAKCDAVNIGAEEEISIKNLVGMIIELSGAAAKPVFDASKPAGQPRRNCDTRKAKEKLGFTAKVGLREGLKRTIAWYKSAAVEEVR